MVLSSSHFLLFEGLLGDRNTPPCAQIQTRRGLCLFLEQLLEPGEIAPKLLPGTRPDRRAGQSEKPARASLGADVHRRLAVDLLEHVVDREVQGAANRAQGKPPSRLERLHLE